MRTIFVLSKLSDPCDDMSCEDVLGVFKTLENAQKAMEDEYQNRLVNILELNDCETEEELENVEGVKISKEDAQYSIYNNGDYYEWNITKWEI